MIRWLVLLGLVLPLTAEAASNVLVWIDNATNEQVYIIERKAEACSGTSLTFAVIASSLPPNTTTFTDSAVVEGNSYCYRVAASNTAGKSAYSNLAGDTIPFTVPAAPSGLTVAPGP